VLEASPTPCYGHPSSKLGYHDGRLGRHEVSTPCYGHPSSKPARARPVRRAVLGFNALLRASLLKTIIRFEDRENRVTFQRPVTGIPPQNVGVSGGDADHDRVSTPCYGHPSSKRARSLCTPPLSASFNALLRASLLKTNRLPSLVRSGRVSTPCYGHPSSKPAGRQPARHIGGFNALLRASLLKTTRLGRTFIGGDLFQRPVTGIPPQNWDVGSVAGANMPFQRPVLGIPLCNRAVPDSTRH